MHMACLDNTQAYNHQEQHTQVYLDLCHLGLLSSKPLITGAQQIQLGNP